MENLKSANYLLHWRYTEQRAKEAAALLLSPLDLEDIERNRILKVPPAIGVIGILPLRLGTSHVQTEYIQTEYIQCRIGDIQDGSTESTAELSASWVER